MLIINRGFVHILTYMMVKWDLKDVIKMTAEPVSICFQYNLHPIFPYSRCFLFSDSRNKLMNQGHICYLHRLWCFTFSQRSQHHSLKAWNRRLWVGYVICRPTLSMRDSVDIWQQWFTEGMGGDLEGKVHICRQYNKIQQGYVEFTATEVALHEHFYEVNSSLYVKKSKWVDRICDKVD